MCVCVCRLHYIYIYTAIYVLYPSQSHPLILNLIILISMVKFLKNLTEYNSYRYQMYYI